MATTIPSSSDAVVIASEQVDNTGSSTNSISNGLLKVQQDDDSSTQTVNEYTLQYPINAGNDDGKGFALLNYFYPMASTPTYTVKATASATGMNGDAKILVLAFNSVTPAPEFPYGVFIPLAVCFPILLAVRNSFRRPRRV